jgi:hypothetical protein
MSPTDFAYLDYMQSDQAIVEPRVYAASVEQGISI